MSCPVRTYPLRRPDGHQPPVPRWQLVFGSEVTHVHVAYIGVQQQHSDTEEAIKAGEQAMDAVRGWADQETEDGCAVMEEFDVINGDDAGSAHVWVCYWADKTTYEMALDRLSLASIHDALVPPGRSFIGLWLETFSVPVSRLETNYTGLDYLPGVARLPNTTTEPHTLTAYWGAARDRIPDSAHDLFETDSGDGGEGVRLVEEKRTKKEKHILGTNADNLVHIRSGQFWETCDDAETDAYERKLEPTLEAGLRYLWENPSESGARGLRYLRNTSNLRVSDDRPVVEEEEEQSNVWRVTRPRKETCVAGYFTSLDKLEGWAKSHKSHLAIYHGAMRHAKVFGDARKFRTWHEVVVLKKGEARFEYVNCVDKTGVLRFIAE
ncbi:Phenylacetaldoxime dehydratase-like protein [Hapsidospora chrysogenum ATCC 11550]|uniref:Phenylacetaldoxime dehydratase-like protein n=1 Tax=Hapsidospora chrysogenum (strain ATCC 11550 / CBS 779.69 / DSM 880 / IAM 14645 / JCM 23072 / IMI 49137) TaxID=857340 RepID=A0A086SVU7_HAPC1|nr:Phenylacetaldoxime dehydratase-like protein [Hapsidospora chrysogenum ATCC 11550]